MSYIESVKSIYARQSFLFKEAKRYFKTEQDLQSLIDKGQKYEVKYDEGRAPTGSREQELLVDRVASARKKREENLKEHALIDGLLGVPCLTNKEFEEEMKYLAVEHKNQLEKNIEFSEKKKVGRIKRSRNRQLRADIEACFKKKAKKADENNNLISIMNDKSLLKVNNELVSICKTIAENWNVEFNQELLISHKNPIFSGYRVIKNVLAGNASFDEGDASFSSDSVNKEFSNENFTTPSDEECLSDSSSLLNVDIHSSTKDVREKLQAEAVSSDIDKLFSNPDFIAKKKQAEIEREKLRKAKEIVSETSNEIELEDKSTVLENVLMNPSFEESYHKNLKIDSDVAQINDLQAINFKLMERIKELDSMNKELISEYNILVNETLLIKTQQKEALQRSIESLEKKQERQKELAIQLSSYDAITA